MQVDRFNQMFNDIEDDSHIFSRWRHSTMNCSVPNLKNGFQAFALNTRHKTGILKLLKIFAEFTTISCFQNHNSFN